MECGRCGKKQPDEDHIVDDGHGFGICHDCDDELRFKRVQKRLALFAIRCSGCGIVKSLDKYQPENHPIIAMMTTRDSYSGYWEYHGSVECQTCELLANQKLIAIEAENKLKTRAIMSLVTHSVLRKINLPDELIKTKVVQMKASNLWQTPKI